MAYALHFNTIGSTFQYELRNEFAFQVVDQKDYRDVFLHFVQEVQRLRFLPVGARVLSHNKVKELRTESFGELFESQNYIRTNRESHPPELMQTALNICCGTMNKEDSQEILAAIRCIAGRSSFALLQVWFCFKRHNKRTKLRGGSSILRPTAPGPSRR